jgi:hypothetical protein
MHAPIAAGRACLLLAAGLLASGPGRAIEYQLRFTPVGNYKDLVVAGYQLNGNQVVGNCSYTRITSGSGRGGRTIYTPVPATCTWDLVGTLLGSAPGTPVAPPPLEVIGTETIYAIQSSNVYAGFDSALPGGFVFNFGSRYTWLTSNAHLVLPQQPYTFTATIRSNGDMPLTVTAVSATKTQAKATIKVNSTTCLGQLPVGGTCDVNVTYTDAKLSSTTGLAYDTFTIHLATDAAQTADFVQSATLEVKIPQDDGGG